VVGVRGREPFARGRLRREIAVKDAIGNSPLWSIGEDKILCPELRAVRQLNDVSRFRTCWRHCQVGVNISDRRPDPILRASVFSATSEKVVKAGAVKRVSERIVRRLDSRTVQCTARIWAAELGTV
jgi:hypothetical protein